MKRTIVTLDMRYEKMDEPFFCVMVLSKIRNSILFSLYSLYEARHFSQAPEMVHRKRPSGASPSSTPNSLSLLILGHLHLGRRNWCMFDGGKFLQFCVNVFSVELGRFRDKKKQKEERRLNDTDASVDEEDLKKRSLI